VQTNPFEGTPAEWDGFLAQTDSWTHFHLFGWKRIMEGVLGHDCHYLAAREDQRLVGVLPLVRVKSLLFGDYLVSMPFFNYGGPVGNVDACRALADAAIQLSSSLGTDLLELRSRAELPLDLEPSGRKVTVVLDLPDEADTLMAAFKSKLRSQIRRPGKEGVEVRFGTDLVDDFYAVFAQNMRDLGTPVLGRDLFRAIVAAFPDSAEVGVAYLEGQPIAAGWGFRWAGELEMTWASSLRRFNRIAPNMLLYWSFMERAIDHGVGLFNFGRCTPGGSTHKFKLQWGGRDEPLPWYVRAKGKAKTPSPDDSGYSWGPRVWSKLPLPLANLIGPRIVKYIP
jgi:FemAB-related protein (PEP-CTERM system-associated)